MESATDRALKAVERHFSVPVENFWFSRAYKMGFWDGRTKFFNRLHKKLPAGLLHELIKVLREKNFPYELVDQREPLLDVEPVLQLNGFDLETPPYDYQAEAVKKALKAGRGVLELATNAGKTAVAAAIIKSLNLPTLFVVGGKDLLMQTEDVFKKTLDDDVYIYGGGKKKLGKITVGTVQSVSRLLKTKKGLEQLKQFKVLFTDETHHSTAKTWYQLGMKVPARYKFGLSGTAFEGRYDKDWKLMAVTGPLLMKVTNAELIERGVSAVPKIIFLETQVRGGEIHGSFMNVVKEGIVQEPVRNTQIHALAFKLLKRGGSVLILTPRKKHGFHIYNQLRADNKIKDFIYYNHGGLPDYIRKTNLEEFKKKEGIMIATTIFDEGIDMPDVSDLIIALGLKKHRKLLQRVGRALRKKKEENRVTIYDFYDWHNKHLLKHSEERLACYRGEGFEVVGDTPKVQEWISKSVRSYETDRDRELTARSDSDRGVTSSPQNRNSGLDWQKTLRAKRLQLKKKH